MPNKLDDSLRPHLSALIDGELEPLEAIAIQRHVRHNNDLGAEQRSLEQLKLAVHLAGTRDQPPVGLRTRLLAQIRGEAQARRSRALGWRWALPLATLAVGVAVALIVTLAGLGEPDPPPASTFAARTTTPTYDLSETSLARLVKVHRGDLSPMSLRDMTLSGALETFENLPDGFIDSSAGRAQVVQASYMDCNPRSSGATFVVLKADRVELPAGVDAALEGAGVYTDVIDGVELRLSTSGDKLFVILRNAPSASVPI
ncbi:MAG: hypothetical protein CVU56_19315 [Deltaproteobacteria bacterium HGW-Deltaproteobacteria-14]|jgi:hypothetical protein|nr:MAG: hypothetical protein CVU56_19315 [Deltaproteobacteria bacterium HGW-Deltaproteobacteria-14]